MKDKERDGENEIVRMELKYCERCGGLWLRECGAGIVYCGNCQPEVADLPAPRKKTGRVKVPVRRRSIVEDYPFARNGNRDKSPDSNLPDNSDDNLDDNPGDGMDAGGLDLEAAGGAA
jgi:hypothetical protein